MKITAIIGVLIAISMVSMVSFAADARNVAVGAASPATATTEAFAREVARVLPEEAPYDYHKRLTAGPMHVPRRDPRRPAPDRRAGAGGEWLEIGLESAQFAGAQERGGGFSGLSGHVDAGSG